MAVLDIVQLDLFKYRSEDFSLSLPVLNADGTPYNFPAGTQGKCTLVKNSGEGPATSFTFVTGGTSPNGLVSIAASTNIILLTADHALMDGVYGSYRGEVLINIPPSDIDFVYYVLHLESADGSTVNNAW